ncbi:MAG TPA: class I SAM-dependent methyltransferase [Anaerolineae bacterium]|nr:class I SAM-dependent methyltransferase [Anaerolineae bacterium]
MDTPNNNTPKLYAEMAPWWPLLSHPADYADEAAFVRQLLFETCDQPPRTLVEFGSGGGNNASHLKAHFQLTLVDRSPEMLAVSRALNPECEHVEGDMRTTRLGRLFDAVFIHDAIDYMTTEEDLRRAMETAFVHCRPGGAAVFVPDFVGENFSPGTQHGGHDGAQRGMRYLEWTFDPDPADTTYLVDFAYILHEEDRAPQMLSDRHVCGVFARADWLRLLREVGFQPRSVPDQYGRDVFVTFKPGC